MRVELYDTTLRDGSQREGISLSVKDKLSIAARIDQLGIHFIEGGWPGSNPKDAEFFSLAGDLELSNAKLVAFGSTCRPGDEAAGDSNLLSLAASGADVVNIVAKGSAMHVTQVLQTTLDENLRMISDSIRFLKARGLTVMVDIEHAFDGYRDNAEYTLKVLRAAADAGAACLVLCDTNGGALPDEVAGLVATAVRLVPVNIGIHAHNDADLAVANSLAAVKAGASHVEGTINGYGERCGNANLCSIIPALKLKLGINCVTDEQLLRLTEVSHYVSEIANLSPDAYLPYVGSSAFSHKAGLHVSGMSKWQSSYQHIDPALVGNRTRTLISELSGRTNIIHRASEIGVPLPPRGKEAQKLLEQVKWLESKGFQYENAEASFDLLVHRAVPGYQPPFELVDFMVLVENRRRAPSGNTGDGLLSEAMVKVKVDGNIMHTVSEGDGPVNALDNALRKALLQQYPSLSVVKLIDYKVRILEESTGTESRVRVLLESTDGENQWRTVGSSTNIIEASWLALADSLEYWLVKQHRSYGASPINQG